MDLKIENPYSQKKTKCRFSSVGPNWVHSMNGHDKLIRCQKTTFPSLAVYGCMNIASRKLLFIRDWTSSNNPVYPARWYF